MATPAKSAKTVPLTVDDMGDICSRRFEKGAAGVLASDYGISTARIYTIWKQNGLHPLPTGAARLELIKKFGAAKAPAAPADFKDVKGGGEAPTRVSYPSKSRKSTNGRFVAPEPAKPAADEQDIEALPPSSATKKGRLPPKKAPSAADAEWMPPAKNAGINANYVGHKIVGGKIHVDHKGHLEELGDDPSDEDEDLARSALGSLATGNDSAEALADALGALAILKKRGQLSAASYTSLVAEAKATHENNRSDADGTEEADDDEQATPPPRQVRSAPVRRGPRRQSKHAYDGGDAESEGGSSTGDDVAPQRVAPPHRQPRVPHSVGRGVQLGPAREPQSIFDRR